MVTWPQVVQTIFPGNYSESLRHFVTDLSVPVHDIRGLTEQNTGYNFDGVMVNMCPKSNAKDQIFKFIDTNSSCTNVSFSTNKECHKWQNFEFGKNIRCSLHGWKWVHANAYSGFMRLRTPSGKWFFLKNSDNSDYVAKLFCKKVGMPFKNAKQNNGTLPEFVPKPVTTDLGSYMI